jgi:hypothetical protein
MFYTSRDLQAMLAILHLAFTQTCWMDFKIGIWWFSNKLLNSIKRKEL